MTTLQNNRQSMRRLKVAALTFALGVYAGGVPLTPASAQDGKPVDLLSIRNIDEASSASPTPELSMDQALDQALDVEAEDKPAQNAELLPEPAEAQSAADVVVPEADTQSVATMAPAVPAEPAAMSPSDNQTPPPGNSGSSLGSSSIYGSAKIGRRDISDVGLAAIGVGDDLGSADELDSLIWRGTSARDAVFLLEKAAVDSRSQALTRLAYRVVARQSVPPTGANIVAADLVSARLAFLANGGRSSDLARLAEQLPDGEKWHDWRRWLVEHHLMMRNDASACTVVTQQITQTMEPFWHKANVVCQAVQGNRGGAQFAADILAANGIDDPIFFGLVNQVLNGGAAQPIDPSQLDSMHIVLMDVANRPIPLEGLAVLPKQMAETVVRLKFLGPDARMVSTFDGLNRGLITSRQAGKLWRSVSPQADDPALALARLDTTGDPLTTALAWRALAQDGSDQRLDGIAAAVKAEINAGQGGIMLPLYAELVREALTDETLAARMKFDDLGLAPKLAMLLAITAPDDLTTLEAFAGNGKALEAAALLRSLSSGSLNGKIVAGLDMWHMLPVLAAAGVTVEDQNWLELSKSTRVDGRTAMTLSPVLLEAVKAAGAERRVAETVLLANWLLQDVPLAQIAPADAAAVITALEAVGQRTTARDLAGEILAEHLMIGLAAMIANGVQS